MKQYLEKRIHLSYMPKSYKVLIFSDFPLPSYKKPHRNVLFIDYAPKGKLKKVFLISPKPNEAFKNNKVSLITDYYNSDDFYKTQHNLFIRLSGIFRLFLKLLCFNPKKDKIDYIRTGSTYLSLLVSLTQKNNVVFLGDVCDFYYELYEEFNKPFAKILKPFIFTMESIAIRRMNLIFVDTAAQREFLVTKMNIDKKKCVVLPNGINVDLFPFSPKKNIDILKQYAFKKDEKILFYSGDISKLDGIEHILRFIKERKDCKALIIGKAEEKFIRYLLDQIQKEHLEERLIIDGFKPYKDVYKYTSIADVCLAPFKITNTTNTVECAKIITYLLMGKLVLATKADGLRSLYKNNITYFKDGNYKDFSKKLNALLENNPSEKKQKQLRKLGEKFDFAKIIKYEYSVIDKYFKNPNQDLSKYDYL